jgi:Zn-dependent peptidase ImmA (M78 family)
MAKRDFWKAEAQADEVLAKHKISALPVDPFYIAKAEGIVCEKIHSTTPGVSGCLANKENKFGIFYGDYFSSDGFCRFTVAHELGHYFLEGHCEHVFADGERRHTSESGFSSDDRFEREADAFAAALLMPRELFRAGCAIVQPGLTAVEALAEKCGTSLTATAIRYADLSEDPITIVVSKDNRVQFAFMSEPLRQRRDLNLIKKNSGIPDGTETSRFNKNSLNVTKAKRATSFSTMDVWFDCDGKSPIIEEVRGLGSYGRTLTVLWSESAPDSEDVEEAEANEDLENTLPSDRWRQPRQYQDE